MSSSSSICSSSFLEPIIFVIFPFTLLSLLSFEDDFLEALVEVFFVVLFAVFVEVVAFFSFEAPVFFLASLLVVDAFFVLLVLGSFLVFVSSTFVIASSFSIFFSATFSSAPAFTLSFALVLDALLLFFVVVCLLAVPLVEVFDVVFLGSAVFISSSDNVSAVVAFFVTF